MVKFIDAGDFKGALEFAKNRRRELLSNDPNANVADTDQAIAALESGDATAINRIKTLGKSVIDVAERRGLIGAKVGVGGGLASAKTDIFDNGTIIRQLPDGSSEVTNPAGDIVTGPDRVKVLKTAREEQIDFTGKQAASKARGALAPEVRRR